VFADQAAQASSDQALVIVIATMLDQLRDIHVNLFTPHGNYRYTGYDARPVYFDERVVHTNYVSDRRIAPRQRLAYGHLANDVGYVWIPAFGGGGGYGADIDTALAALNGVSALVVDVRSNGGGNSSNGQEIVSRFVSVPELVYGFARYRSGPRHDDFTAPVRLTVRPHRTLFTGRVVVLTNRASYSAAEDFVLAMSELPAVSVVGDSTGGGSGNPIVRELPNGWTFRLPQWVMYTNSGTIFEENGLPPDVFVRGSVSELQAGRDAILDSAIAVARRTP
jgi:C-terminal processing protease CtpA/Prc